MGKVRIGVSGWDYDGWVGDFYPEDLPRTQRLEYVARHFDAVEVNGSFYGLLKPDTYRRWFETTPRSFRFALKGSRFITHNKKLADVKTPLANFLGSGPLALGEELGPILWQLPEEHRLDGERLRSFAGLLPSETEEAAALAEQHDHRVGDTYTQVKRNHRLRHVLEVRNQSFFCDEAVRILRDAGVALAVSHAGDWPLREEVTAGFVYLRLHGAPATYRSGYDGSELDRWARRIRAWWEGEEPPDPARISDRRPPPRKGRDVWAFLDNDAAGHAPRNARELARRVEEG